MKKKEKTIYGLIGSILLLVLIVGTSYSYIKLNKEEKETNILGTDCIKLEMEEESEAIMLHHAYPVTDEVGKESKPYTFRLTNQCGVGVNYEIHLRVEDGSSIKAENIATSVDDKEKVKLTEKVNNEEDPEKEEYKINSDNLTLKPYETVEHKVRIWLDKDAGNDTQNGVFKSKVVIEAVQNQVAIYKEELLNGADPVLYDTTEEPLAMLTAVEEPTTNDILVPIQINEENGEVTKADVTQQWYNYEKQQWANAVILVDNEKAKTLKAGDKIEETDIESYFVWIPKYRYKLFNLEKYEELEESIQDKGSTTAIEIEFGLEDTKDDKAHNECKTPNASGDNGQCQKGDWMTHPAFTAFPESHGMWVGKFETGYNQDETNSTTIDTTNWNQVGAQKDTNDSTKVIIKPNVYSWRNITIGNAYETSYKYQRDLDSHMMKNTEWGAVAYLTQSIYGRCRKENDLINCNETLRNNAYQTGHDTITNYPNSKDASTTGNNTGIFDMNGGAIEFVMAFLKGEDGSIDSRNLDSNILSNGSKYYDIYNYNTIYTNYSKRILGDATGELGPFQREDKHSISSLWEDAALFIELHLFVFARGGYTSAVGNSDGIFYFNRSSGEQNNEYGFRIVLTPTNDAL